MRDLLVEIHTEELPPKSLRQLAESFLAETTLRLTQAKLTFSEAQYFATPRRLALIIKNLSAKQPDETIEKRGPSLAAAFQQGKPTKACEGFARSLQISPEQLITIKNEQGEWVGFQQKVKGKSVKDLVPAILQQGLNNLPIPKRMRWGDSSIEFIRPVHSVILLYGDKVIPATILGLKTDRITCGHRFLSKGLIRIKTPDSYSHSLEKHFVIVDFNQRKEKIIHEINKLQKKFFKKNVNVILEDSLLEEVTGLVEWPVALSGAFNKTFLDIPQEALISAMRDHQRYFHVTDNKNKLLPYFITISNIKSKKNSQVIDGNERVLTARLSDAAFFFTTDKKIPLPDRRSLLKNILFHNKLGNLLDKSLRVSLLSQEIAKQLHVNDSIVKTAAELAKTDLTSQLVGEFPELQGIAGYYYALSSGFNEAIATAIKSHYLPRYAGDTLPHTLPGSILAIADRIDTLVGIFGIKQSPTGDKDPYGLRRAALGILRILIENKLDLNLLKLLEFSQSTYGELLKNSDLSLQVFQFMLERLKQRYQEQNISATVFASVAALKIYNPYDIHRRIQAVQMFRELNAAEALSTANKRVSNILSKYTETISSADINAALFKESAEKVLYEKLSLQHARVIQLSHDGEYTEALKSLADLRDPVDMFFDKVLVMTDEKPLRENRLLLLKKLRELFLHVADIAYLQ